VSRSKSISPRFAPGLFVLRDHFNGIREVHDHAALGMSRSKDSYYRALQHADEQRTLKRSFVTRRGVVYRSKAFERWFRNYWHDEPPRWWKQMWHRKARAVQKAEMRKNPEDPLVTPMRRIVDLWDWY
jgi:hypothetical protein